MGSLIARTLRLLVIGLLAVPAAADEPTLNVRYAHADNDGVKIHYATAGKGPLVVMIHGFPDFWYTWRHQMAGLQDEFQVVAIDQRGYNKSDSPDGAENYAMPLLVSDVMAVIRSLGHERATIVGHDWGGVVAWTFAFMHPQAVHNLVILNLPHPNGLAQAWSTNPKTREGTGYARKFIEGKPEDPDIFFDKPMTPETLSGWVTDPEARKRYVEAFGRSDFKAMLDYYKTNYPRNWEPGYQPGTPAPKLSISTLVFHGLQDTALHSDGLNNTWDWIDADLTIVTTPDAGHFVQQDAAELVTGTMRWWLLERR